MYIYIYIYIIYIYIIYIYTFSDINNTYSRRDAYCTCIYYIYKFYFCCIIS